MANGLSRSHTTGSQVDWIVPSGLSSEISQQYVDRVWMVFLHGTIIFIIVNSNLFATVQVRGEDVFWSRGSTLMIAGF